MKTRVPLALAGALAAGVLMSVGQTISPEPISPLFNSAAPVVALAAAVSLAASTVWPRIVLGAAAGPLAMVGYYVTADLRGFGVSTAMVLLWCTAGVIAGAAMGAATWVLRAKGPWPLRSVAAAVFPGIALGEAAHGLTRIADTTPVAYWWGLAALGIAVLAWLAMTRLARGRSIAGAVAATAVFAASLYGIYGLT